MSTYTTAEWIEKVKKLHPNTDYDGVVYKNNKERLKFFCTKHQVYYEQNAKSHAYGYEGCPECKRENQTILTRRILGKSQEQALKEIKENIKNPENLDFSQVKYVNATTPLSIICNVIGKNGEKHGEFKPNLININYNHCGCPKCYEENKVARNKLSRDEIIARIKEIHSDKYDLSLIPKEIKNIDEEITLICKEHGEFQTTPHRIFYEHAGCQICGHKRGGLKIRLGKEELIRRAKETHGEKYDYSLLPNDILWEDNVDILCPIHGVFTQCIGEHIQGHGCQKCNESHLERQVRIELEKNEIKDYLYNDRKKLKGLELDFYLPNLNLGIECQGSQHFEEDHFMKELKIVQERDLRKKHLCEENNIRLVYFLEEKFEKYINKNDIYFTDIEKLMEYIKELD